MISPFLNFDSSTGHFLKNAKISLLLLIGPFLIRTDCVYCLNMITYILYEFTTFTALVSSKSHNKSIEWDV